MHNNSKIKTDLVVLEMEYCLAICTYVSQRLMVSK